MTKISDARVPYALTSIYQFHPQPDLDRSSEIFRRSFWDAALFDVFLCFQLLVQDVTETDTKTPKAMSTHTRSSTRDDLRNITIEDDNEKNKHIK